MDKAELVEQIANQTRLTKKTSRKAVDAIISAITDSLAGRESYLSWFWHFSGYGKKSKEKSQPSNQKKYPDPN